MGPAERSVILNYGQSAGRSRRRLRALLIAIVVVGSAYAAWRIARPAWREYRARAVVRSWVRECLRDAPGDDVVAFEGDPARASILKSRAGYVRLLVDGQLELTGRLPLAWAQLAQGYGWGGGVGRPVNQDPVAFLHARRTPEGRERLVVVQCIFYFHMVTTDNRAAGLATDVTFCARTFDPDVPLGSVPIETSCWIGPTITAPWKVEGRSLRVMAGQAHAADESHFTISFEADGKRGVIDGWLRQGSTGGDEVVLKLR